MTLVPTYVLKIYNNEYYKSSQVVPMPFILTENEYWILSNIDGLDAGFMGLDVQQGTDASGNLFLNPEYDERSIAFTLSIKQGKEKAAIDYLSRYVRPGVFAVLYDATLGDKVYMKGSLEGWSVQRFSNSISASLTFQPWDRCWYQKDVKIQDAIVEGSVLKEFRVQTDLPSLPVVECTFGDSSHTNDCLYIDMSFNQAQYSSDSYDTSYLRKGTIVKSFKIKLNPTVPVNQIKSIVISCVDQTVRLYTVSQGVLYVEDNIVKNSNWDWCLESGVWWAECNPIIDESGTVAAVAISSVTGFVNPRFAVCPRVMSDPVDGLAFSPNLKAQNIRNGIEILGVLGTGVIASEGIYDGPTEVVPSISEQVLATKNKQVGSDITVRAVPAYEGPYEIAPSESDQTLQTNGKMSTEDIVVKAAGSTEVYEGPTEVIPTLSSQVLETSGKKVPSDITVRAIAPVNPLDVSPMAPLRPSSIRPSIQLRSFEPPQCRVTSVQSINISDLNFLNFAPQILKEGWYNKAFTPTWEGGLPPSKERASAWIRIGIAGGERTKIVPENIKKGVTILGIEGTFEGSGGSSGTEYDFSKTGSFASRIKTLDANDFSVAGVANLSQCFSPLANLTAFLNLNTIDTQSATDMTGMFKGCSSVASLDLSSFNTKNVKWMDKMFEECRSLTSLDLSSFNTENVVSMLNMFAGCTALTSIDLSSFNTQNVTNMFDMFKNCAMLTTLDLSNFNTEGLSGFGMGTMFHGCLALTELDLSSFNTSNIDNMGGLFSDCASLVSLNVSSFDTSKVTNMLNMFGGCASLVSLNLSNFDVSKVDSMAFMFSGCARLSTLTLGAGWASNAMVSSFDLSDCSALTHDSIIDVLNKLAVRDNNPTLALHADTLGLLSDEEKAIATNKGWTIA